MIKRIKNKIIIDRSKLSYVKPENTIKRISRFLATLSDMCVSENFMLKNLSSEELEIIIKKNFSYIWKIYYEFQIPSMVNYKNIFKDLESFHIFGICAVNQHIYAKKLALDYMSRDSFIKSTFTSHDMQGLNAMSISDISSIPRATVIRKLKRLVKVKNLTIDDKKHYRLSGNFANKLLPAQKEVFAKLAKFSSIVFNIHLLNKKYKISSGERKSL